MFKIEKQISEASFEDAMGEDMLWRILTNRDLFVVFVFGITIFNYNIHYPNLYAFGQEITEPKNYGKLNSYIEVQGQVTSN